MTKRRRWRWKSFRCFKDTRYILGELSRIESLKIVSRSQFNQGKTPAAEQTIREAIRMIVGQWGKEELMGKDEINEQLDGVQGLLC